MSSFSLPLSSSPHFKNRSPFFFYFFCLFFAILFSLLLISKRSLPLSIPSTLSLAPPQTRSPISAVQPPISPSDLPQEPSISASEAPISASEEAISEIEPVTRPDPVSLAPPQPQSPISAVQLPIAPSGPPQVPSISASESPISASEAEISEIEPVTRPDPVAGEVGDGDSSGISKKRCNLYEGRWVKDEVGRYPLYAAGSCPHVDNAFTCQENGRPDGDYLKWRWKPNDCELPRFNATDFLERLRGKRVMLVGDSVNRNQFESILCLLREALPDKSKMYETRGHIISKGRGYFNFLFDGYNCTIEFVQSHFLARQGLRVNGQGSRNPILQIDRVDRSSNRWKKADILVFNTGHWWAHGKTARGKNFYKEGYVLYPQFDATEAFRRALKTWGRWIDENIDHRKSLVFYRGYSSAHFRGGDWDSGGTCNGETEPAVRGAVIDSYPLKMKIVDEVVSQMKFPVILLNVTKLTNFRKDGHPSIYGTPNQKASRRKQDCSHWCLPGVPDAWNELIYATLVLKHYRAG